MNQQTLTRSAFKIMEWVLQINYYASIVFLFVISAVSMSGSSAFFEDNVDLYGPLSSNLKMMLVYLSLMQLAGFGYLIIRKNCVTVLTLGAFFILLMGSIEFYGMINQIEVDENYQYLFLYCGLSNLFYGTIYIINKSIRS